MPEMPQSFIRQTARKQKIAFTEHFSFLMQNDFRLQEKTHICNSFIMSAQPFTAESGKGKKGLRAGEIPRGQSPDDWDRSTPSPIL